MNRSDLILLALGVLLVAVTLGLMFASDGVGR